MLCILFRKYCTYITKKVAETNQGFVNNRACLNSNVTILKVIGFKNIVDLFYFSDIHTARAFGTLLMKQSTTYAIL